MGKELKMHWFCAKCNVRKEVLTIGQSEEKVCDICGATIPPHKGNCVWMDDNTLNWNRTRRKVLDEVSAEMNKRRLELERKLILGDKA